MTDAIEEDEPKENLKPLKMLVFSMGLLLIGGTLLLCGMVWKKVNADVNGTSAAYSCAGGETDLTGRGQVLNTERDGRVVYITLQKDPKTMEVVTVDLCSAKVKSAVKLLVDGKKR